MTIEGLSIQGNAPSSERDRLIALTFGVILVTLVGQGLSLIPLIRWLNLTPDGKPERERQQARLVAAQAALTRLQDLAGQQWVPEEQWKQLRVRYEEKARHASELSDEERLVKDDALAAKQRLCHELIEAERAAVIHVRDQGQIDDTVLREIERELDLEEQQV